MWSEFFFRIIICICCISASISYIGIFLLEKINDKGWDIIEKEGCAELPYIISYISAILGTFILFSAFNIRNPTGLIEMFKNHNFRSLDLSEILVMLYFFCSFVFSCFVFVELKLISEKCITILKDLRPNVMFFSRVWREIFILYITSLIIGILVMVYYGGKNLCHNIHRIRSRNRSNIQDNQQEIELIGLRKLQEPLISNV
jgi:hypothetical protein